MNGLHTVILRCFDMQVLLILTKSVNKCFEKNSKFDMTPLLGGTEDIFSSLIHAFGWFVYVHFLPDYFH